VGARAAGAGVISRALLERLRRAERWAAIVRLLAVPFAVLQILLERHYPAGYELWVWLTAAVLAAGGLVFLELSRRRLRPRAQRLVGAAALVFDTAVVASFVLAYTFQTATPVRQLLFLPVIEAALRYGMLASIGWAFATTPILVGSELLREHNQDLPFRTGLVTLQLGIEVLTALIVGWLVQRLVEETRVAQARAREAEQLRDTLGRRVDLLEAANRCARALGSSLEVEHAFKAFVRELRGLIVFERATLALEERGLAQVMASAGVGSETVFAAGESLPPGSLLEEVTATGETVYRDDMSDIRYPEEHELGELGLRSRIVAPLQVGARSIGALAVVRSSAGAFTREEIELLTLLARLVATSVQNIRAYEAERRTVGELRRLSSLRDDFVAMVSHELRGPMSAVIGAARTLEHRWAELAPEQRSGLLSVIGGETARLTSLIGDVLDTSRIEAGTFTYSFGELDLAELVLDSASAAELGHDEIRVETRVGILPAVRGDRQRLRQVLVNLIENAVKYSPAGETVTLSAAADDHGVHVDVSDHGPGIALEDQRTIFEKFGRLHAGDGAKAGTGLGLFIARSIAEAHGGTLTVRSSPDRGATFRLALPAS
jgi:signal transduction histidine kinase